MLVRSYIEQMLLLTVIKQREEKKHQANRLIIINERSNAKNYIYIYCMTYGRDYADLTI